MIQRFKDWLSEVFSSCLEEKAKRIETKIKELSISIEKIAETIEKKLEEQTKIHQEVLEKQKENLQLLKKLITLPVSQKGIAIALDWRNFSFQLKDLNLYFPGRRIIDEAITAFERPKVVARAFCEGFISFSVTNMLEQNGFSIVSCKDADSEIIEWLWNEALPNFNIDIILLITEDKRLINKANNVLSKFYPQKQLIILKIDRRRKILKDEEGKYQLRLRKTPQETPRIYEEENPYEMIVERIKQDRLVAPMQDPRAKFFLIVVRTLPELKTTSQRRGFENLKEDIWNHFLYANKTIDDDKYLREFKTKYNLQMALEALLNFAGDILIKKQDPRTKKIFYEFNNKSSFWKQCVPYLREVEKYVK
jgi:hypothetical protein